jgi:hypothetical protein
MSLWFATVTRSVWFAAVMSSGGILALGARLIADRRYEAAR